MLYVVNDVPGNELSLQLISEGSMSHMHLARARWVRVALMFCRNRIGSAERFAQLVVH